MDKKLIIPGTGVIICFISLITIFLMTAQTSHPGTSAISSVDIHMNKYHRDVAMSSDYGDKAKVQIMTAGKTLTYNVEVAASPREISQGLMFRTALATDAGMLFVFDRDEDHYFWMDNTLIPLDMIYISGDGRVVGVRENAVPRSREPITPPGPSKYVLEVNGDQCRQHRFCAGDIVTISLM
jgi:uncharacterized membrane protein (UPF0127 family)